MTQVSDTKLMELAHGLTAEAISKGVLISGKLNESEEDAGTRVGRFMMAVYSVLKSEPSE